MIIQSVPKRTRTVRRPIQKEPDEKEKRGRKRKEREEEAQEHPHVNNVKLPAPSVDTERERKEKDNKEKDREKEKKKILRTPTRPNSNVVHSSSSAAVSHTAPSTPSLKIRLPRLNNISGLHATSASG